MSLQLKLSNTLYQNYREFMRDRYPEMFQVNQKPIGAPESYMRGWYDCLKDVGKSFEEFEKLILEMQEASDGDTTNKR